MRVRSSEAAQELHWEGRRGGTSGERRQGSGRRQHGRQPEHGSAALTVGLDDFKGLFHAKGFCDFKKNAI